MSSASVLAAAKKTFWQEILQNDLLAELIMSKVNGQSSEPFTLPQISGEPWLPSDDARGMRLLMSKTMGDESLPGISISWATPMWLRLFTIIHDDDAEHILLWKEEAGVGYAADEDVIALDVPRKVKAEAALAWHQALTTLMCALQGVEIYYDFDRTITDSPADMVAAD